MLDFEHIRQLIIQFELAKSLTDYHAKAYFWRIVLHKKLVAVTKSFGHHGSAAHVEMSSFVK